MKKLIVFDLDGTLLYTARGLRKAMNMALEKNGCELITEKQTTQYVGNGSLVFAQKACKDQEKVQAVHKDFLTFYASKDIEKPTPYEGIKEVLSFVKKSGYKIAVFSNKPQFATVALCNEIFGENTFDYILGHVEGEPLKPNPSGMEKIITALNVTKQETLHIGDGDADALVANNCGVDFIGALWGFRSKKQLKSCGAKKFAYSPSDLINLILYFHGRKKVKNLFAEFKKFISKGNVLDMAVGVIIGSAFSAIVNSLVKDVITPVISLVTGGVNLADQVWTLKEAVIEVVDGVETVVTPALTLNYGNFIQAIINFLLIAITVFLFVKTIVAVQKSLDVNANMKAAIQKKLDNDEALNAVEEKWMARMQKKDPSNVPTKTVAPPPPAPAEPSSTDKLLMQILEELKKENK